MGRYATAATNVRYLTILLLGPTFSKLAKLQSSLEENSFIRFPPHLNNVSTLLCETQHSRFASERQLEL